MPITTQIGAGKEISNGIRMIAAGLRRLTRIGAGMRVGPIAIGIARISGPTPALSMRHRLFIRRRRNMNRQALILSFHCTYIRNSKCRLAETATVKGRFPALSVMGREANPVLSAEVPVRRLRVPLKERLRAARHVTGRVTRLVSFAAVPARRRVPSAAEPVLAPTKNNPI